MTRLAVPSGVPLAIAARRLSPGYMVPAILDDGVATASSVRARATATASATPHTKGSWTQIIAATTTDASMLIVRLTAGTSAAGADTSTLLDIGIGAAASEVVIVPNLAVGFAANGLMYHIPVSVPVGSRIAIRCQGAVVSQAVAVQVMLATLPNSRRAPAAVVAMGDDTATSHGVIIATPASNNTKGAWTQIIAATAQPFSALVIGAQGGADSVQGSDSFLLDIGIGSAGNEVVIGPDLPLSVSTTEILTPMFNQIIPWIIPAGTRLAARVAITGLTSTLDVILYGVPA